MYEYYYLSNQSSFNDPTLSNPYNGSTVYGDPLSQTTCTHQLLSPEHPRTYPHTQSYTHPS